MMQKVQKGTRPGLRPPLRGGDRKSSPLGRGAASAAGWVVRFVRCRRAAATALGAALMSLMSLGGFALTSDHTSLVYQRDTLKAATEAASFATSRHWQQALSSSLTDAQIKTALLPIARRYILANIPAGRRTDVESTLTVQLTLHHGASMVDVDATADLSGGTLVSGWMLDADTAEEMGGVTVETRTERLESDGGTIEVALAIDDTNSMNLTLAGETPQGDNKSRITIVKQAAKDLIDILTAATDSVAVGVVPWNYMARLDQETARRWKDNGWLVIPTRHYYPNPYTGSYKKIPRASAEGWFPDPHLVTLAGEWHNLPAMKELSQEMKDLLRIQEAWVGCVDQRRMSGTNPPGISTALPTAAPFTMTYYPPYPSNKKYAAFYLCRKLDPLPPEGSTNLCYHNPLGLKYTKDRVYFPSAQPQPPNCHNTSTITPLDTDTEAVKQKIDDLDPEGGGTHSKIGVVWGHRLLASTWRTTWNSATHPVNKAEGVQKVIVLLTDGEDNHLDSDVTAQHLDDACTAAKDDGIKIFVIAAMHPDKIGDLKTPLTDCSSKDDDPDGTYVFINNATSDELRGAFRKIGRQLVRFRRVY